MPSVTNASALMGWMSTAASHAGKKTDHAAGGTTRLDNLICLCQLHHTLIHKPGWQIAGAPGALVFIRPDGTVVGRAERCPPTQLPPPPPVDPDRRFRACGDRLTTWAHDLLLAHWLSLAS